MADSYATRTGIRFTVSPLGLRDPIPHGPGGPLDSNQWFDEVDRQLHRPTDGLLILQCLTLVLLVSFLTNLSHHLSSLNNRIDKA